MKITLKVTLLALIAGVVAACAVVPREPFSSLRDGSVNAADSAPTEKAFIGKGPGNAALIPRTFAHQPPLIPHTIDGYEEISAIENPCLDCHIDDELNGKKMPRVHRSHLLQVANAQAAPVLAMQYWQCNSCHVAQTDAKPLVENVFQDSARRP